MWFKKQSYSHNFSYFSVRGREELSGQDSVYVMLFIYGWIVTCAITSMQENIKKNINIVLQCLNARSYSLFIPLCV